MLTLFSEPGPLVHRHSIIKIESDLAHAGLNSDHVKFRKSNRLTTTASAPRRHFNPTSRSSTPTSIRSLNGNHAVIPVVAFSFYLSSKDLRYSKGGLLYSPIAPIKNNH